MRDVSLLHGKIDDRDLVDMLFDGNSGMIIISIYPGEKVKVVAFDLSPDEASEICSEAAHGFKVAPINRR